MGRIQQLKWNSGIHLGVQLLEISMSGMYEIKQRYLSDTKARNSCEVQCVNQEVLHKMSECHSGFSKTA